MSTFPLTLGCPLLSSRESVRAFFPVGTTLAEAVGDAAYSLAIEIGGVPVPREQWPFIRPRSDVPVNAMLYAQGGGNGSKYIRMAAMLVLTYFTAGAAGGMFATAGGTFAAGSASAFALAAGISIVGTMHGDALAPQQVRA